MSELHILKLYIKPLGDLHCGYGLQQGNVLPGYDHIPGRVIRGALANWALRMGVLPDNTCDAFRKRFQTPTFTDSEISFPYCYWRGHHPIPASVFRIGKGDAHDPKKRLVSIGRTETYARSNEDIRRGRALDFLLHDHWPCQLDPQLKPVLGMVKDLREDPSFEGRSPLTLDMRNRHDPRIGRVGEDGLYAEEILTPSWRGPLNASSYQGLLICTSETAAMFERLIVDTIKKINRKQVRDPDPKHLLFLGRRRIAAGVWAEEENILLLGETQRIVGQANQQSTISESTLSFISPYLPTQPRYPITDDLLKEDLGKDDLKIVRRFCLPGWIHGFEVSVTTSGHTKAVANRPGLEAHPCFAAGTCISFQPRIDDKTVGDLTHLAFTGIGRETATGHGRFVLNASLHQPWGR